jgi:hypothetical protein
LSQFYCLHLNSYHFRFLLITDIIIELQISYFDTIQFQPYSTYIIYNPKIDFLALISFRHNDTKLLCSVFYIKYTTSIITDNEFNLQFETYNSFYIANRILTGYEVHGFS